MSRDLGPYAVPDVIVTVSGVSREEAHRRPAASGKPVTTGLPAAGPTVGEAVRPQPPLFTARTDKTAGVVSAHGQLDLVGAEALCRTVTALQQHGHRQIVVRLGSTTIADDAGTLLEDQVRLLSTAGVRLLLR